MWTGKFKPGDKVRIINKSCGDPLSEVIRRHCIKNPIWSAIGKVEDGWPHHRDYDYAVSGNFYKEEDLAFPDEALLEKELFEI